MIVSGTIWITEDIDVVERLHTRIKMELKVSRVGLKHARRGVWYFAITLTDFLQTLTPITDTHTRTNSRKSTHTHTRART